MPTFESEMMREARNLARLERLARGQRAALKRTMAAIRKSKRDLKTLVSAGTSGEWTERGAKSKVFPSN